MMFTAVNICVDTPQQDGQLATAVASSSSVGNASATVLIIGRVENNYTLVKGNVSDWLAHNRIPALGTPMNRGWWIRNERLPDVVALAEHQGLIVKAGPR